MKILLQLWEGVSGLASSDNAKGSRKLEVAFLGLAVILIAPEVAVGVGLVTAGYCLGQGIADAAEAKKAV